MELFFKTKTNKNGNTYRLSFDTESKTFRTGYSCRSSGTYTTITLTGMRFLKEELKNNNYKEI